MNPGRKGKSVADSRRPAGLGAETGRSAAAAAEEGPLRWARDPRAARGSCSLRAGGRAGARGGHGTHGLLGREAGPGRVGVRVGPVPGVQAPAARPRPAALVRGASRYSAMLRDNKRAS